MNKIKQSIFIFGMLFLFLIPMVSFAQFQGIPCGQCVDQTDYDVCLSQCGSGGSGGGSGAVINCSNITNFDGVFNCAVSFLDAAIYLLIAFAFVYTLWGAFNFIRAEGTDRDKWKLVMIYGIIGLFVMVSIWGLVNILSGTFGFSNTPVDAPTIRVNISN